MVDLDREGQTLLVRSTKRGAWRRVPITPQALLHVLAYLHHGRPLLLRGARPDPGHLFVTTRGTPFSSALAFLIVRDVARAAGLRAYPHALRRAIATHLVQAGAPVPAVQALLGHRRLATTATYVGVDREDLRRTVRLLERGARSVTLPGGQPKRDGYGSRECQ